MAPSLAQRLDRSLAVLGTTTLIPIGILALAWGQELLDAVFFGGRWNLPMVNGGSLLGVLTAPFSHSGFGHLISNSIAFLPLSWLVLLRGREVERRRRDVPLGAPRRREAPLLLLVVVVVEESLLLGRHLLLRVQ
jgi:membrane associated rhomboid family serine protease